MPEINLPDFNLPALNRAVRDSAYVAIGFGVLGFQRAQVRRRELVETLQASTSQLGQIRKGLSSRVDELEQRLPAPTKGAVSSLRNAARSQEALLRSVVSRDR